MDEKKKTHPARRRRATRGRPGDAAWRGLNAQRMRAGRLLRLLGYLDNRKLLLALVFVLMLVSTCELAGGQLLPQAADQRLHPAGEFQRAGSAPWLVLGGIYLVGVAASYLQSRLMVQIAQKTTNRMRRELFVKMQSLPLKYFDTQHPRRPDEPLSPTTWITCRWRWSRAWSSSFPASLTFVGAVVMMMVLSPLLFVVTFLVLGLMFFLSGKLAGKSSKYFKAQQKNLGSVNGYIEEMVDGLKVVKVFTHEGERDRRVQAAQRGIPPGGHRGQLFTPGWSCPIMSNLNNIAYAATAMFGGILAVVSGFDIGSLAAFLQYSRQVGFPVSADHQPAQQHPVGDGRGRAGLRGDGPGAGSRRRRCDPGGGEQERGWLAGR